jgi:uncharacterized cupin superfamily protein
MQTTTYKAKVAKAGEGKNLNLLGNAITIKISRKQSLGSYFVFECLSPPGFGVPSHVHEREDELVYVIEGEYSVLIGNQKLKANPGDYIFFPRNVVHAFQNTGIKAGRLLFTVVPGANFEEFFEKLSELPAGNQDMKKIVGTFAAFGMDVLVGKETHL